MQNNLQAQITWQSDYINARFKKNTLKLSFLFINSLHKVKIYLI